MDTLSAEACLAFCLATTTATRFAERKHETLRGFFTYLRARGHITASPLREPGPRVGRTFRPYIYSRDQVRGLLEATAILINPRSPLQSQTFRILLLLLYGAGLRAGEALRLRCADIDFRERVVTIWDSKFFKSRHAVLFVDDSHVADRGIAALRALRRDRRRGERMTTTPTLGPFFRRFLLEELIANRNLSINTQKSYRDTFRLLFRFLAEHHKTDPTVVTVEQITSDVIRAFLAHLEERCHCAVATRNQRLAALRSLFRFIGHQVPELIERATQIQGAPIRRAPQPTIPYLEKLEVDAMLAVPDRLTPQGRRDYALLLFLYNTGARATEAAELTIDALALEAAPAVRVLGKGRKIRHCPLWPHTAAVLRALLGARLQAEPDTRVFLNVRRQPSTRFGIHALVDRTVALAAKATPSLTRKRISPHTFRHTTAVHLLRAGVDINTILAWLGHASLETTNRYAEVDLEMKAKALETCAVTPPTASPNRGKAKLAEGPRPDGRHCFAVTPEHSRYVVIDDDAR